MISRANVVIVGGGIAGISVAYHLAAGGMKDVVLLEKETMLGTGSSAASAGVIYHHHPERVNLQLSSRSLQAVRDFENEFDARIDFHQNGCIQTAGTPEDMRVVENIHEELSRMGVESQLLKPGELTSFFPGIVVKDLLGAIYTPGDGHFDPHGMIQGYAARARRLGVKILSGIPAVGMKLNNKRISAVETSAGEIKTEFVVNAAGPAAAAVAAMSGLKQLPVVPYKRQIFFTAPSDAIPADSPFYFDRTPSFYFRPESGGLIMSIAELQERRDHNISMDWESAPILAARATHRIPALESLRIVRGWAGLRSMTPDHTAILGPVPELPGLYLAVGFSGHGVMHAPMTGKILASMIINGNTEMYDGVDLAPLRMDRFAR